MRQRPAKLPNSARWFSWSSVHDADDAMYRLFRREGRESGVRGPLLVCY